MLHLGMRRVYLHLVYAYFLSLVNIPSCRIRPVSLLLPAKRECPNCPVTDLPSQPYKQKMVGVFKSKGDNLTVSENIPGLYTINMGSFKIV